MAAIVKKKGFLCRRRRELDLKEQSESENNTPSDKVPRKPEHIRNDHCLTTDQEPPRQGAIEFSRYSDGLTLAMKEMGQSARRSAGMYLAEKRRKKTSGKGTSGPANGKTSKKPRRQRDEGNEKQAHCDGGVKKNLVKEEGAKKSDTRGANATEPCPDRGAGFSTGRPSSSNKTSVSKQPSCPPSKLDSTKPSNASSLAERGKSPKRKDGLTYCDGRPFVQGDVVDPCAMCTNSVNTPDVDKKPQKGRLKPDAANDADKKTLTRKEFAPSATSTPKSKMESTPKQRSQQIGRTYCDGRPFDKFDPSAVCSEKNSQNTKLKSCTEEKPTEAPLTYCDGRPFKPEKVDPSAVSAGAKRPKSDPKREKPHKEPPKKKSSDDQTRSSKTFTYCNRKPLVRPNRTKSYNTDKRRPSGSNQHCEVGLEKGTKDPEEATKLVEESTQFLKSNVTSEVKSLSSSALVTYCDSKTFVPGKSPNVSGAETLLGPETTKNRASEQRGRSKPKNLDEVKTSEVQHPTPYNVECEDDTPTMREEQQVPHLVTSVTERNPFLVDGAAYSSAGNASETICTDGRAPRRGGVARGTTKRAAAAISGVKPNNTRPRPKKNARLMRRKSSKRLVARCAQKKGETSDSVKKRGGVVRHSDNKVPKSKESCRPKEPMPKSLSQSPRVQRERQVAEAAKEKCDLAKQKRLENVMRTKTAGAKGNDTTDHPEGREKKERGAPQKSPPIKDKKGVGVKCVAESQSVKPKQRRAGPTSVKAYRGDKHQWERDEITHSVDSLTAATAMIGWGVAACCGFKHLSPQETRANNAGSLFPPALRRAAPVSGVGVPAGISSLGSQIPLHLHAGIPGSQGSPKGSAKRRKGRGIRRLHVTRPGSGAGRRGAREVAQAGSHHVRRQNNTLHPERHHRQAKSAKTTADKITGATTETPNQGSTNDSQGQQPSTTSRVHTRSESANPLFDEMSRVHSSMSGTLTRQELPEYVSDLLITPLDPAERATTSADSGPDRENCTTGVCPRRPRPTGASTEVGTVFLPSQASPEKQSGEASSGKSSSGASSTNKTLPPTSSKSHATSHKQDTSASKHSRK